MLQPEDYTHTVSLKYTHDNSSIKNWCSRMGMPYKTWLNYEQGMVPVIEYHFDREQDAALFSLRWSENVVDTI